MVKGDLLYSIFLLLVSTVAEKKKLHELVLPEHTSSEVAAKVYTF